MTELRHWLNSAVTMGDLLSFGLLEFAVLFIVGFCAGLRQGLREVEKTVTR